MADDFVQQCVERCIDAATDHFHEEATNQSSDDFSTAVTLESPLEEAFARCWVVAQMLCLDYVITLRPQVVVGDYRLDFVLGSIYRSFPKLAVELDGHEFHEKTREQVTRRNTRDRYLQMTGWKVFHVSGSEFFRDPLECVRDIHLHAIEEARVCDYQEGLRRA
jgi:very-short-patch-repair endonuclease